MNPHLCGEYIEGCNWIREANIFDNPRNRYDWSVGLVAQKIYHFLDVFIPNIIHVGAIGLGPLQQMHPGIVVGAVHRPELSWDVLQRAFRGPCVGAFPGKNDELRCVSGIR